MRIAVIGAGIVGITTAYELARDGHDVIVFEKNNAAAEGASFANAGMLSSSLTMPWAIFSNGKPSPLHILKSLQGLTLRKGVTRHDLRWLWTWGQTGRSLNHNSILASAHGMAVYSHSRLQNTLKDASIDIQHGEGHLVTIPNEACHNNFAATISILREAGIAFSELPPDQAIKIEPALGLAEPFHGALHFPQDQVANCRQFALSLRTHAERYGVRFQFGQEVIDVTPQVRPGLLLQGDPSPQLFDAIALCTGRVTEALSGRVNTKIPIATIHGYSCNAMIREPLNAPRNSIMDADSGVVIARLGNRLRICGGSELGGPHGSNDPKAIQALFKTLHRYFPGAIHYPTGAQIWRGARVVTNDGLPIVGANEAPGIWLNLAHGSSGWTNACGAARLLADLIGRKTPSIDASPFSPTRGPR